MSAKKRNPLQKLQGIVRLLAQGLTVKQACAVYSCSDEWFFGHTRAGHEYEYLRDEAEAAMVSARLRDIDKIGKDAHKAGDYKTALNAAVWKLEKLQIYRKQFGADEQRNIYIGAQQINYTPSEEKKRELEAQYQASTRRLRARETNGNENESAHETDGNENGA
jgi:hypothetical protein